MNPIHLKISNDEYLQVTIDPLDKDGCLSCCYCDIEYINNKNQSSIKFGYDYISSFCYFISDYQHIPMLINGEMKKQPDLDLGLNWNEYYEGKIISKGHLKYSFVSNSHKKVRPYFDSWLYNDQSGNIILEITPFYPWHNTTKRTNPEKKFYSSWIRGYKPTVKTIIPKENIEQWITQAKHLKKEINGK